jgi:hypothetical protein
LNYQYAEEGGVVYSSKVDVEAMVVDSNIDVLEAMVVL